MAGTRHMDKWDRIEKKKPVPEKGQNQNRRPRRDDFLAEMEDEQEEFQRINGILATRYN